MKSRRTELWGVTSEGQPRLSPGLFEGYEKNKTARMDGVTPAESLKLGRSEEVRNVVEEDGQDDNDSWQLFLEVSTDASEDDDLDQDLLETPSMEVGLNINSHSKEEQLDSRE